MLANAMTVDVEDYFQVSAFEERIDSQAWGKWPLRVEANTRRIMELFSEADIKATFFMLGWVAQRFPQLVQDLVATGHELASHGRAHVRVCKQTPKEFRQDVEYTKKLLEDVAGCRVNGYRAASYSIGRENLWALDVLEETGHEYSSSIYPIHHDLYGMPEAPRGPFRVDDGQLIEIPVTTVQFGKLKLPCGGGGYFRLLPYKISRAAMRRVRRRDGLPCVFYFHPWEIDPQQPRVDGLDFKRRFRHYVNLNKMESRLSRLLKDFKWSRMDKVFLQGKIL